MSRTSTALPIATQPTRPTNVRWQIVALLVAYSFMTWFNRISMTVAYDERLSQEPQVDISPATMGGVYSAFLIAYTVFMTPGGWFIDRFGPWLALVVMGLGSALFCALTGAASQLALVTGCTVLLVLLVIRAVMGVLTAPVYPASSRMVAHWLPSSQRAWANGLVQGAAAVGISCTFPVFGADRLGRLARRVPDFRRRHRAAGAGLDGLCCELAIAASIRQSRRTALD